MKIFVENRNDYRAHAPRYENDNVIITLNYMHSEDGQRYFPRQAELTLKKAEWWEMQIEMDKKIKELE